MKKPLIIGHRGAKGEAPENTLLGIRYALEKGVDGVEIDVHLTSDKHLIVMHDPHVGRTTNGAGLISDLALGEVRALDAGKGEKVPVLDEVIETVGDKELFIEVKCTGAEETVVDHIHSAAHPDTITVKSFDHRIVKKVKELDSTIRTACIIEGSPILPHQIAEAAGADVLSISAYMLRDHVAAECRKHGLKSFVWCAETREQLAEFTRQGFDYICTSFPGRILGT